MRKKIIIIVGIILMLEIGGAIGTYIYKNYIINSIKATQALADNKVIADAKAKSKEFTINDFTTNAYMKKYNLTIKAKDVQFNMKNNLDKKFVISGIATLGDYYNFGFTDDENYFCINLDIDDTSLDSWYLYCDRSTFSKLSADLESGSKVITATCVIPKKLYESKQGNLARVINAELQK